VQSGHRSLRSNKAAKRALKVSEAVKVTAGRWR
jgi:hypothetical protein